MANDRSPIGEKSLVVLCGHRSSVNSPSQDETSCSLMSPGSRSRRVTAEKAALAFGEKSTFLGVARTGGTEDEEGISSWRPPGR